MKGGDKVDRFHHGGKHGGKQADLVLEKELWILSLNRPAAEIERHWA